MTTAETLDRRLVAILTRQLRLDGGTSFLSTVNLSDLGLDSLGMLAFIASIEREFEISVSDRDYESLATFGDAVALICRLRRA